MRTKSWRKDLIKELKDPKFAVLYLYQIITDSSKSELKKRLHTACNHVIEATKQPQLKL